MDTSTFAQKIKAKYPAYQNVDDATLVTKFIEKYPVYKSQVNIQSETGADISQTGSAIENTVNKVVDKYAEIQARKDAGTQGGLRTKLQQLGVGAGTASGVIGDVVTGAVKAVLPQSGENLVKQGLATGMKGISDLTNRYDEIKKTNPTLAFGINAALGFTPDAALTVKDLMSGYEKLKVTNPALAQDIDSALGFVQLGLDVTGIGETAGLAKNVAKKGFQIAETGANKVVGAVDNLITDSKTLADDLIAKSQPKVTLEQATGKIIQGKTGDVKQAVQAIGAVDTTGVKTYKDLLGKLKEKKPELLSVVDNELAKDTTQYSLDNLSTTVATNSGKTVSTNYVDTALKDLRELYSTTGDVKQLANLEELAAKGSYTLKEVNDISRVYNSEFGQKAFSKLGDPLTSVNAQRFENTRKGLKDVARRGIGGAEAKKADELLSSVYNTENLVKRNMEAVNKLRQRINERGLLEKAGHYITKYADILTGGTIRGAVAGLLPRGAGYKVLNALDLEEQLAKNLDIINKALTSKSDDIIVNQLKSLDLPIKNSTSKTTPSMGAKTSTSKLNTTNDASLNSSIPTVSKKNVIKSSDLSTGVKNNKFQKDFDFLKKEANDLNKDEFKKIYGNLFEKINRNNTDIIKPEVLGKEGFIKSELNNPQGNKSFNLDTLLGNDAPKQYKNTGIKVEFGGDSIGMSKEGEIIGRFIPRRNTIQVSKSLYGQELEDVLMHEIEHALQFKGNPTLNKTTKYDLSSVLTYEKSTLEKIANSNQKKRLNTTYKSIDDFYNQANKK
jgi:hypothetical protein